MVHSNESVDEQSFQNRVCMQERGIVRIQVLSGGVLVLQLATSPEGNGHTSGPGRADLQIISNFNENLFAP